MVFGKRSLKYGLRISRAPISPVITEEWHASVAFLQYGVQFCSLCYYRLIAQSSGGRTHVIFLRALQARSVGSRYRAKELRILETKRHANEVYSYLIYIFENLNVLQHPVLPRGQIVSVRRENTRRNTPSCISKGASHLVTQVSFYLCYSLNVKKDRTIFVSTCIIKWKAPYEKRARWNSQASGIEKSGRSIPRRVPLESPSLPPILGKLFQQAPRQEFAWPARASIHHGGRRQGAIVEMQRRMLSVHNGGGGLIPPRHARRL